MPKAYPADELRAFVTRCLEALAVPSAPAGLLADTLVQADLWGHQSHGVMRTFWYGDRIRSGAMSATAKPALVFDGGALALMDGNDGIGQVVAAAAMDDAIRRARAHGIGAVSVRNSGHFGTAMYFTRMAAVRNCIGVLCTNASPAMAPWGGREKRVGTNPWSIAAPAGRYAPMMLDVANTAVARGKLYLAQKRGERIPVNWAIDADGNPTDDPAAGIAGTLLPMAGHKGYAIAAMMDVLSGVLSGSLFGDAIGGPYQAQHRSGAGHLAIAIDIARCRPVADFTADMERLIAEWKATPTAPGVAEIFYPGELEARAEVAHRRDGISLPAETVSERNEKAEATSIRPLD